MKKNIKLKSKSSFKSFFLIIILCILVYSSRNILIYRNLINYLETKQTEAVIINEKEYMRFSHFTDRFSYYYEFKIDGKTYKNPSFDEKYRLGNTIKIIYSVKYPFINKPIEK